MPARQAGAGRKELSGGGCEGDAPLLKFLVCWDAAVCAVSAGGFFLRLACRSLGGRVDGRLKDERTGALPFWPAPLEFLRVRHGCGGHPVNGPGPSGRETTSGKVRCGDYRERPGGLRGGDPGRRTRPEDGGRREGSLSGRNLFARRV